MAIFDMKVNPIVKATAQLIKQIRGADPETLQEAIDELESFRESWLISGENLNLNGAGDCCLADTDTANGVIEALETWIQ